MHNKNVIELVVKNNNQTAAVLHIIEIYITNRESSSKKVKIQLTNSEMSNMQ